jgi:hypothetical protein
MNTSIFQVIKVGYALCMSPNEPGQPEPQGILCNPGRFEVFSYDMLFINSRQFPSLNEACETDEAGRTLRGRIWVVNSDRGSVRSLSYHLFAGSTSVMIHSKMMLRAVVRRVC